MNIGFIGLGNMGKALVPRLLQAGHEVHVWNRSPEPIREMVAKGAKAAATPVEATRAPDGPARNGPADFLITMLANDEATRAVVLGQGVLEAASPGLIHLNLATISVALAKELADLHGKKKIGYIAAPVFGRPQAAAEGQLNIVVAGDPGHIARAQPILSVLGQKTWPVGEQAERANAVKIAGNFMIMSAVETLGEAVALMRAHGVGAAQFLDILTNTLFSAPVYKLYGGLIAAEKYEPAAFAAGLALKDVRLALTAADAHSVPMPLGSVLRDALTELVATGSGESDVTALARLAARRAGL